MEDSMEITRERRATAHVVANAMLLVAVFAGLSHAMAAAFALAVPAVALFSAVAMLPRPRRVRAR
jgi:hypothetical protein